MKKENILRLTINVLFYSYFGTLIAERVLSLAWSLGNGVNLFGERFHLYAYLTVFLSLAGFLACLVLMCRKSIHALIQLTDEAAENIDFTNLSITSGVLLLSGMVHTEYTIPVIQFIAYGALIIGLLLQVLLMQKDAKDKGLLWLSFVYLLCFSMAIPVSYPSTLSYRLYFYLAEVVATYGLVIVFTIMMIQLFSKKEDLFKPWYFFAAMVVLDGTIIALQWQEEINMFVLIFACASTLLFLIGIVYKILRKQK